MKYLFLCSFAGLALCAHHVTAYGLDMVEVAVEVTEVNNDKANELGIKWLDTVLVSESSIPSIFEVGELARTTPVSAEMKLLLTKGAARILSKPKLLTKSGTTASFLVGGEVPIVASGVGGGSIDWKQFGIRCEVSPKVMDEGSIDFSLTTEVSRLDWTNQVNGNPALMKREATSSARLKNGQTVALAGLIETTRQEQTIGIPLLSEIPVLGGLFGRKRFVDNKSTVLIFVTPRIVEQ